MWNVFPQERACCLANFPYSTRCGKKSPASTAPPTKYPTLEAPPEDDFENIPMRFIVFDLPDNVKIQKLKKEIIGVLTRILDRLTEVVPGLKVLDIEEKVVADRALLERPPPRALASDVTLYYNVYVERNETVRFGPLVIEAMRNSYGEVLAEIRCVRRCGGACPRALLVARFGPCTVKGTRRAVFCLLGAFLAGLMAEPLEILRSAIYPVGILPECPEEKSPIYWHYVSNSLGCYMKRRSLMGACRTENKSVYFTHDHMCVESQTSPFSLARRSRFRTSPRQVTYLSSEDLDVNLCTTNNGRFDYCIGKNCSRRFCFDVVLRPPLFS